MNVQMLNEALAAEPQGPAASCRICGMALRHSVVDLGMSPPCEKILRAEEIDRVEEFFPLHVMVCENCLLVQLREYVAPDAIFEEYGYYSSYSTSWVEHARRYVEAITARMGLGPDSLVVEVASNDGYLLQHFLPIGVPVLGIEPAANVADAARMLGVPTRVEFFGKASAARLLSEGHAADLIIGNNVLAQVPDINDFVAGMVLLLKPQGVITLEFPHVANLLAFNQFDTIYHEHYSYFSLLTIENLAERHGLRVVDVEELHTHGGSLRIYLAHCCSDWEPTPAVAAVLARERKDGLTNVATYAALEERARKAKRDLLNFLIEAKNAQLRICAYGAPGKGNTLLNYCGIGRDFLDFTVDRNPYKHGRFTPGMHVPILQVEAIDAARPDLILILPWNLRDEIVEQMSHIANWGGRFVVPIPTIEVIHPKEVRA